MWALEPLSQLCELFTDGDWIESKDQSPEGIRLVQTGNVGVGEFKNREEKARYISDITFKRLNCEEIFSGDCLISRLPDPVGRACIIPENISDKMITAVDCTIARFKKDKIMPSFFSYYAQSSNYFYEVEQQSGGATRKRISRKNLGALQIPLPPLPEQKRIVAVLDEAFAGIDQAIENTEKAKAAAQEMFDSSLNAIFTQRGDGWVEKRLGEVCKTGAGGTPLKSNKSFYESGDIPWLLSGEVGKREITKAKNFITQEGLHGSSAKLFPKNSVLIAMYGATAGEVGMLRFEAATNQAVCAILPNKNFLPEFLFYFFNFQKDELVSQATGNAQPNISQIKIKNTKIPCLALEQQTQIVQKMDTLAAQRDALVDNYTQKLAHLQDLKQSLLAQAFSGKLTNSREEYTA